MFRDPTGLNSCPVAVVIQLHLHEAAAVMVKAHGLVSERQSPALSRLIALVATVLPNLILLPAFNGQAHSWLGWCCQAESSHNQQAGLAQGADQWSQWMEHGQAVAARVFFQPAFRRTKAVPWPVNI